MLFETKEQKELRERNGVMESEFESLCRWLNVLVLLTLTVTFCMSVFTYFDFYSKIDFKFSPDTALPFFFLEKAAGFYIGVFLIVAILRYLIGPFVYKCVDQFVYDLSKK